MPLRPRIVIPCLLFTIFLTAHSQVKLGVEAGPDFPRLLHVLQGYNVFGETVNFNSQTVTRLTGSVFVDIPLGKLFTFRPRLQYLGAGGEIPQEMDFNGNLLVADTKYTLNYFNLPLQLLFSPSLPFGKPWIGGGFSRGILLGGKAKSQQEVRTLKIGSDRNDDVQRFDFSYNATAGITLKWGILVGVEFQQSLVSIAAPPFDVSQKKLNTRNSIWSIHLGYEWQPGHW